MDEIKAVNGESWKWLLKDEPKHSSVHAFDELVKTDHVTNTMTESFNAWLDTSRQLPILTLAEFVRRKMMKRFHKRYMKGSSWDSEVPPIVRKKLNQAKKLGRRIQGLCNGDDYEVDDENMTYFLNLRRKTCECGLWQISGLHAMACIHNKQVDPEEYLPQYFTKSSYLSTYKGKIATMLDSSTWPAVQHPTIQPPTLKLDKPGRPKMNRRREEGEPSKPGKRKIVIHCKFCHENGHNQAGYPKKSENQAKKGKRKATQSSQNGVSSHQIHGTTSSHQNHATTGSSQQQS